MGNRKNIIDTYIFDLDGTLLDTSYDLTSGFNYALSRFGYKERTRDEFLSFVGNGVKKALERAIDENISEEELNKITGVFKKYYLNHMFEKTVPYNGIVDMLETLKKAGCITAVVSNKFDDAVKMLCKKYFDGLIDIAIGEGYGIKRKPDSSGTEKVFEISGSDKVNAVYIGDSDTDILTARNAGIPCISVLWGFRSREFLEKSGAAYFAETPEDIVNFKFRE